MTRETKVGLVIGLGVILLVGIIVSEYFVRDEGLGEQPLAEGLSDFNNNSNQSVLHNPVQPDGGRYDPYVDRGIAASAVEQVNAPPTGRTPPAGNTPGMRPGPNRLGANVALENPGFGERVGQEPDTPPATAGNPLFNDRNVQPEPRVEPNSLANRNTGRPGLHDGPDVPTYDLTQPPALENAALPPTVIEHTVAEQETLTHIARQYYDGDGNMWRSIRDANPETVGPEGQVRAGTVLRIPKRSASASATPGSTQSTRVPETLANGERAVAQRGRLVTVQEGDTLSDLASEHMGSAGKWQELLDANTDVLTDPKYLRPGMRLRIPGGDESTVAELANAALGASDNTPVAENPVRRGTPAPTQPPAGQTYTVRSGDSLYRIAERTMGSGNRYHELYEANKDQLSSPDAIREGMVLRIPQ